MTRLNWLPDQLLERAQGVTHVIVLSSDGLLISRSSGLSAEEGEHLAATASSFQSLARHTGKMFNGGAVRQTVIEMEHCFLFVCAAGPGACLAVLSEPDADIGLIAYEMNMLVKQLGRTAMTAEPRSPEGVK